MVNKHERSTNLESIYLKGWRSIGRDLISASRNVTTMTTIWKESSGVYTRERPFFVHLKIKSSENIDSSLEWGSLGLPHSVEFVNITISLPSWLCNLQVKSRRVLISDGTPGTVYSIYGRYLTQRILDPTLSLEIS